MPARALQLCCGVDTRAKKEAPHASRSNLTLALSVRAMSSAARRKCMMARRIGGAHAMTSHGPLERVVRRPAEQAAVPLFGSLSNSTHCAAFATPIAMATCHFSAILRQGRRRCKSRRFLRLRQGSRGHRHHHHQQSHCAPEMKSRRRIRLWPRVLHRTHQPVLPRLHMRQTTKGTLSSICWRGTTQREQWRLGGRHSSALPLPPPVALGAGPS